MWISQQNNTAANLYDRWKVYIPAATFILKGSLGGITLGKEEMISQIISDRDSS